MKPFRLVTPVLLSLTLVAAASCRQLYTTSLASALPHENTSVPASTSVSGLADLAAGAASTDKDAAKEVLDVLAGKDQAAVSALTVEDQTAILNIATTATVELSVLADLANQASAGTLDQNTLIADALSAFDASVNLAAVVTILQDPEALAGAPVESLVFASAAVVGDVAAEVGADVIMTVLASGTTAGSTLTAAQAASIDTVLATLNYIDTSRTTDTQNLTIGGFNISDLLRGTQP